MLMFDQNFEEDESDWNEENGEVDKSFHERTDEDEDDGEDE